MERRYQARLDELLDDAEVRPGMLRGLLPRLESFLEPFARPLTSGSGLQATARTVFAPSERAAALEGTPCWSSSASSPTSLRTSCSVWRFFAPAEHRRADQMGATRRVAGRTRAPI